MSEKFKKFLFIYSIHKIIYFNINPFPSNDQDNLLFVRRFLKLYKINDVNKHATRSLAF